MENPCCQYGTMDSGLSLSARGTEVLRVIALTRISIEFQSLLGIELALLVYVSPPKQERAVPNPQTSTTVDADGRSLFTPTLKRHCCAPYGGPQPSPECCHTSRASVPVYSGTVLTTSYRSVVRDHLQ